MALQRTKTMVATLEDAQDYLHGTGTLGRTRCTLSPAVSDSEMSSQSSSPIVRMDSITQTLREAEGFFAHYGMPQPRHASGSHPAQDGGKSSALSELRRDLSIRQTVEEASQYIGHQEDFGSTRSATAWMHDSPSKNLRGFA